MIRPFILAVVLAAVFAGTAAAQQPAPPTGGGKKSVSVDSELRVAGGFRGYVFLEQVKQAGGAPAKYTKLELSDTKPHVIRGAGRSTYSSVYAVPEEAAKEFKTDKELFDAVDADQVPGLARLGFTSSTVVDDTVPGNRVTWTYTVVGVDGKNISVQISGEGYETATGKAEKGESAVKPIEPGYLIGGAVVIAVLVLVVVVVLLRKK